ncbi:MAG: DNA replication and repair protein RecF [Spirochaetales bacterium]|nr:DNA replication and repair protein RecF [Spirochaetales bacterium]
MISRIRLLNFRNYDDCTVEFSHGLNCLVGYNGQGKTNVLEGVYYLSLLRSFRTSNINELRQWNRDFFTLRGSVSSEIDLNTELEVTYGVDRRLTLNGSKIYRASDFINKLVCVTFIPEDLSMVQGTPSVRRRFLDIAISQISPEYLRHLQAFTVALKSRNALLKEVDKYSRNTVTAYDTVLAKEGAFIEIERLKFSKMLNVRLEELSGELVGDERKLSINYMMRLNGFRLQSFDEYEINGIEKSILENLEKNYEKDVERGNTGIGPHHSDFTCLLGGVNMSSFASQGECRLCSLSLKLGCLTIVKESLGRNGVTLLVDDVIGELDSRRRASFFNAVNGIGQTIFACTEIPIGFPKADRVFKVNNGEVLIS